LVLAVLSHRQYGPNPSRTAGPASFSLPGRSRTGVMKTCEIHSRTRHAQPTAVVTATSPVAVIGPWLAKTYGALASVITTDGAGPGRAAVRVIPQARGGPFAVEAGFPVSTAIEADGDVRPSELPGSLLLMSCGSRMPTAISRWSAMDSSRTTTTGYGARAATYLLTEPNTIAAKPPAPAGSHREHGRVEPAPATAAARPNSSPVSTGSLVGELILVGWLARRALDERRMAAWDADWLAHGPGWTSRRLGRASMTEVPVT
jgi:hypothetical protein